MTEEKKILIPGDFDTEQFFPEQLDYIEQLSHSMNASLKIVHLPMLHVNKSVFHPFAFLKKLNSGAHRSEIEIKKIILYMVERKIDVSYSLFSFGNPKVELMNQIQSYEPDLIIFNKSQDFVRLINKSLRTPVLFLPKRIITFKPGQIAFISTHIRVLWEKRLEFFLQIARHFTGNMLVLNIADNGAYRDEDIIKLEINRLNTKYGINMQRVSGTETSDAFEIDDIRHSKGIDMAFFAFDKNRMHELGFHMPDLIQKVDCPFFFCPV